MGRMDSMESRIFIKGFDKDLKCRGYQFEIGKDYKIDLPDGYELTQNDLCSDKVFHFCDGLSKVHQFYGCNNENNRYCIIEVLGQFCETDDKCGSNHIKIVREITGEELKIAKGLTNGNSGLFNSGSYNSGSYNSGSSNSGWYNSGSSNSGWCNSGSYNSGSSNSGWCNSGSYNSGWYNSGSYNSGSYNSGIFNKTDNSNGVFCNVEPKICIFNIQTDWTLKEFYNSKYYDAIMSSDFPLTEWKSKAETPENGVDGELIVNTYEEACRRWWDGMSQENREIIKSIPNFNIDVFCDITGIDKKEV